MSHISFFAKESLKVAGTYPLSPITAPMQPASTSSAQETLCDIAGGDGTLILQSTKHIFDFVASPIRIYVVGPRP
jgi:hypothetical protein